MTVATRTVAPGGTTMAQGKAVSDPGPHDVWRRRRNSMFLEGARTASRLAIAMGALLHLVSLAMFVMDGYPTWRVAVIGALYVVFAGVQRTLVVRAENAARVEGSFVGVNLAAQLFVVGCASLTGGIHSPFMPSLALPSIVSLLFFGPIATSRWMALCNGALVAAMLSLPGALLGPRVGDPAYAIIMLAGLTWSILALHLMAGTLAIAASRADDSYDSLREERVAAAEAQLRRLQSVGAKVAHELKNPLASIKGLCQLVARAPDAERTQERLAVVSSEIERMETILHEYLSFSRPLEDLRPESFDVTALGRDVLDVLAGRADQAGVTLAIDGAPVPVRGDPRRLKEALINLVANAIEATPDGGNVGLRVRTADRGVTVEVKDTGRGIADDDLARLGTSFFTTRQDGTGLGVVLAQGVIAQHGGTLTYASRVGQGTTATILLPSEPGEPASRATGREARA